MERFIFDGTYQEGPNTYLCFACNDADAAGKVFEEFLEEDIEDHIIDRVLGDYNLIGCTIFLTKNTATGVITEALLSALISNDDGLTELEPETIELTTEQIIALLNKVEGG